MQSLLIILAVMILCQTAKFIWRLFENKNKNLSNRMVWVYLWATGAPSGHAAVLTSALMFVFWDEGGSAVFVFSCVVAAILMYNLVADREREEIRRFLFGETKSEEDKVTVDRVIDISGHTFFDIWTGVVFGFCITLLLVSII